MLRTFLRFYVSTFLRLWGLTSTPACCASYRATRLPELEGRRKDVFIDINDSGFLSLLSFLSIVAVVNGCGGEDGGVALMSSDSKYKSLAWHRAQTPVLGRFPIERELLHMPCSRVYRALRRNSAPSRDGGREAKTVAELCRMRLGD